jgi:hypothetical protein
MELLSELEIVNRGIIKNVILTLDDGEIRYPSGHWANRSGTRMYSLKRVQIAESLFNSNKNGIYYHDQADELNKMELPITQPYIIFDYRIIADEIRHLYESVPRPFLPSFPGFEAYSDKRRPFVIMDLINISNYAFPEEEIKNEEELTQLLDKISNYSKELFPNTLVRIQVLKKNIFTGKSQNAAKKILQIISLIKTERISTYHFYKMSNDIFKVLAAYPTLRIDHKIYKTIDI